MEEACLHQASIHYCLKHLKLLTIGTSSAMLVLLSAALYLLPFLSFGLLAGGGGRAAFVEACRWFDQECAGYVRDEDLEDIGYAVLESPTRELPPLPCLAFRKVA